MGLFLIASQNPQYHHEIPGCLVRPLILHRPRLVYGAGSYPSDSSALACALHARDSKKRRSRLKMRGTKSQEACCIPKGGRSGYQALPVHLYQSRDPNGVLNGITKLFCLLSFPFPINPSANKVVSQTNTSKRKCGNDGK